MTPGERSTVITPCHPLPFSLSWQPFTLAAFEIDKFQVTNRQFSTFLNQRGAVDFHSRRFLTGTILMRVFIESMVCGSLREDSKITPRLK